MRHLFFKIIWCPLFGHSARTYRCPFFEHWFDKSKNSGTIHCVRCRGMVGEYGPIKRRES